MLSLLAQTTSSSPFGTYAPALPLALCVLAGAATWLLMPRPSGSKTLNHVGAGLALIAFATFLVLLIQWAAVASGLTSIYFWLFSFIALAASVRVITHPQPVYSSLYFVLTVFASAGLFVLMWAEFLAMALVIIYAGAILVTYTFVIMLASEASGEGIVSNLAGKSSAPEPMEHDVTPRSPLLACLGGFVTMGALLFVIFDKSVGMQPHGPLEPNDAARVTGNIQQLGVYLFTQQAVALELAGLILTLAMVGAMMIARKRVLLSDDEQTTGPSGDGLDQYITGDDNPHSISVYGQTGPRTRKPDQEMAQL